jgi:glycosyltransferase involved in cell wall biosynthesis
VIRVTFASYDDDPPIGGQGVVLHGMRDALRQDGVHVHTVSGRGTDAIAYPWRTGRRPLDLSLQLNRNRLILYRDAPDLIHAFGGPGGVLIWRRLLPPLVYTALHTYRQAYTRTRVKRGLGPLEARAYRRAAAVLAISRSTADAVLAMGVPATRIEVVPPGIDIPATDGAHREPGRLLFVGRLEPEKGVLDALAVMRALSSASGSVRGVIVGDGRLAGSVQRAIAAGNDRIEYLGRVGAATLQREFARASVLLMPSRYEGLGLTALEALAAGTPVVGYDVTGLRDAVGGGGKLVPCGDREALQLHAARLLAEPTHAAELAAGARERIRKDHSWPRIAARLHEIYRRVTG